jgi:hypothetical protein
VKKYPIVLAVSLFAMMSFSLLPNHYIDKRDTFPGDSCLIARNLFKIDTIDATHNGFHKPAIENLTTQIAVCYPQFKYPKAYMDHKLNIVFPAYLTKLNYEFGDSAFTIRFDDPKGERTICIYYDFANEMKATLLDYSKKAGQKVVLEKVGDRELIFSKNWQGEYTASFFENGMAVGYYTKQAKYAAELKQAILSFQME